MVRTVERIEIKHIDEDAFVDGEKVLKSRIEYPLIIANNRVFDTQNQYFYAQALKKKEFTKTTLYPQAITAMKEGTHGIPYELNVIFTLTNMNDPVLSLYQDEYTYTGGAHGMTVRTGFTFNTLTGQPMNLCDFMKDKYNCTNCIIEEVINQITNGNKVQDYFDDYSKLVKDNFNPKNFYIVNGDVVVYFDVYQIAPYASGIPIFVIPKGVC